MALPRIRNKVPLNGQKYTRPVLISIGMSDELNPSISIEFEDVVEAGGEVRRMKRFSKQETLIEEDVLAEDGVTVAIPNNLQTAIPILNQTTGQQESTITYEEFFKILASASLYLLSK